MRKVRVIREMPFAKVGDILTDINIDMNIGTVGSIITLERLIETGWLEWVEEEKTLEEKLRESLSSAYQPPMSNFFNKMSEISKQHALEVFDNAKGGMIVGNWKDLEILRKALEDM